jgi:hypothetical protein
MQNAAQVKISAFDDKQVLTATQGVSLDAFTPQHISLTQPGFHNATSIVFDASWTTTGVCQELNVPQAMLMLDELELATAVRNPAPASAASAASASDGGATSATVTNSASGSVAGATEPTSAGATNAITTNAPAGLVAAANPGPTIT